MTLKIKEVNIDSLVGYARNARTHSKNQIGQIAASIKEFGFCNPVLIDNDGGIIAGHGRVLAAQKLDMKTVPTICLGHLSETQRRAYVLADNKIALNAGWDEEMLKLELKELKMDNFDLAVLGFDNAEIDILLLEKPDGEPVKKPEDEWVGMPEAKSDNLSGVAQIIVHFETMEDLNKFAAKVGQTLSEKTKSIWFPKKKRTDLQSVRFLDES